VTLVIGVASLTGVHAHEAFQLIDNAGGVFYALTYLVCFAIPLFGMKALGVKAPWWLKIACASGFHRHSDLHSFLDRSDHEVKDLRSFGLKIVLLSLIANVVGVALYVLRKRK
jgi:hypothetical protein